MTERSASITPGARPTASAIDAFRNEVADHLYHSLGTAIQVASKHDLITALSLAARDRLIDRARRTADAHYAANPKYVYYLSAQHRAVRVLLVGSHH